MEGVMKIKQLRIRLTGLRDDESGNMAVIVALLLVLLLSVSALAVDYGHLAWVQHELKKAAEAGALAGARGLWPQNLASAPNRDPDSTTAATCALNTATSNKVETTNLATIEVTVEVGQWIYATRTFVPGGSANANAVRVTTHRSNIKMYFAQAFGLSSKDLSATATAIMDFVAAIGGGALPISINKMYTNPGTVLTIAYASNNTQNGGWFVALPDSASAQVVSSYINDGACPPLSIGQTINLSNGQIDSSLHDLANKLSSSANGYLLTFIPVVETASFNQSAAIIGFVPFKITLVDYQGNPKYLQGTVITAGECASGHPGPHPAGNFGTLSPPKLVN
jgi:Flp pilus assembly protein TadG